MKKVLRGGLFIFITKYRWLKQIFCNHDYEIVKEYDDFEERDRLVSNLAQNETIVFSRWHCCQKCGNKRIIGSGIIS
jgi:hypothetical protein